MRKVGFFIGFIVLFGFIAALNSSIFTSNPTGNTIVDAIEKTRRNVTKIVYTEQVKGGVVVFYKKSIGKGGESVASGYVKKTLWGWQWSWGGEHSDGVSKGFSAQYFPYVKGTPFPLLFGEVKDKQIKYIKVAEKNGSNVKEAKIVGKDTDLFWFTFLNKSEGPNFTVTGSSGEGTTLYTQDINTDGNSSAQTVPVNTN
ncbi:hypothetical protein ACPUYX_13340 [Desulfosporosinus sp. SYSU MS00001]|uniref:hypothetical protein n=1 Tax=Desulfosporosinus sp. SYSU MS00001 TaxID=3416284 RepID=UPI003CF0EB3D